MDAELEKVVAAALARGPMSAAERNAQRRSFVRGQFGLAHPELTEEEIDAVIDRVMGVEPSA